MYKRQVLEPFGGLAPDSGTQASSVDCLVSTEALTLTAEQLVAWLWGCRTLEELEPQEGIPYWCDYCLLYTSCTARTSRGWS